jgi:methyl-accepting chemotaxis protein
MQFFAYKTARDSIEVAIGQTALNITRSVIGSIDIDKFEALKTQDDMKEDYYLELREHLDEVRNTTGLTYLYTMRKTEEDTYIYIVDGVPVEDQEASLLGAKEEGISDCMKLSFEGQEGYELGYDQEWGDLVSAYIPITNKDGDIVGILGADFQASHVMEKLSSARNNMLLTAGIIAMIGIIISVIFSSFIIRSLKQLQGNILMVKQGDLTVKVVNNRSDEVGILSQTFQSMVDNTAAIIMNIRKNTFHVVHNITQINDSMIETGKATEDINKAIADIADGANNQVSSTEEVSESMERVFQEIQTITQNVELVTHDSDQTMKDTMEAVAILKSSVMQINIVNDAVDHTAVLIKQLETKFNEIQSFSKLVSSIASQTNLLSLNASIEAATAGEHGKGFSIVAGEIKKLAAQSGDASKRIQELILSIQEEINNSSKAIEVGVIQARDGVSVIHKVEDILNQLLESNKTVDTRIHNVAESVKNIEADSNEVYHNAMSLADISKEFSAQTQESAAATEEQLAFIEDMKEKLEHIVTMVEQLGETVNTFTVDESNLS